MFPATERLQGMSQLASAQPLRPSLLSEAERVEAEAWVDIVRGLPPQVTTELGMSVVRDGGTVALRSTGVDHLLVNRVLGTGSSGTLTQARVEQLVAGYRSLGISRYFVQLGHAMLDEQVQGWLGAAGLVPYPRRWVKLGRALGSVTPAKSAFEIARVTHVHADACAAILARGFDLPASAPTLFRPLAERPRWHLYAAFDGGRPVATAGLFVDGFTAYLAFASTLPAYRRRGAQSALLERRLRVALALGATFVVSETGEAVAGDPQHSYGNLSRAGLRPLGVRESWAPPETRW
jgi:GNAT superfamily N-acetyltransferase